MRHRINGLSNLDMRGPKTRYSNMPPSQRIVKLDGVDSAGPLWSFQQNGSVEGHGVAGVASARFAVMGVQAFGASKRAQPITDLIE